MSMIESECAMSPVQKIRGRERGPRRARGRLFVAPLSGKKVRLDNLTLCGRRAFGGISRPLCRLWELGRIGCRTDTDRLASP